MMMRTSQHQRTQKGFALLMAVLISSVVLAIGLSILNITLKQFMFSGTGRESEIAFYAADAGMECALYWDTSSQGGKFDIGNTAGNQTRISCMGNDNVVPTLSSGSDIQSGVTSYQEFEWGLDPVVCAKIAVTKYRSTTGSVTISPGVSCPQNATCTRVESRGYNRGCANLADTRTVERALRASY